MPALSLPRRAVDALAKHLAAHEVGHAGQPLDAALAAMQAFYEGMFPGQVVVLRIVDHTGDAFDYRPAVDERV